MTHDAQVLFTCDICCIYQLQVFKFIEQIVKTIFTGNSGSSTAAATASGAVTEKATGRNEELKIRL
jgi:hypothetical protein